MGCAGSVVEKLKPDTTGAELDAIERALITGAGVSAYIVRGAGKAEVNGTYTRDGQRNGAPLFQKGQIWLVRIGDTHWYLADKDKLDEEDGDYYSADCGDILPSISATFSAEKDGKDPPPTLEAVYEGPFAYDVSGAGKPEVNGRYIRNGMHEGSPLYVNGKVWLVRRRGNWFKWYLADKNQLDDEEGDFYSTDAYSEYPATSGWNSACDGCDPPPTLKPVNEGGATLKLCWAADVETNETNEYIETNET